MTLLRYIEVKSGFSDNGPAWIGRVTESRSRRTVYFDGKALKRGAGTAGNYFDSATGTEYWVSGVKKRGTNRHWAGSGRILVEAAAIPELLQLLGTERLDPSVFAVTHDIRPTDPAQFVEQENAPLEER
jgi:hypothetical protein